MAAYRTEQGWRKRGRHLKPRARAVATLSTGEKLYKKDSTCYAYELPRKELSPDSWYLGDDESYS